MAGYMNICLADAGMTVCPSHRGKAVTEDRVYRGGSLSSMMDRQIAIRYLGTEIHEEWVWEVSTRDKQKLTLSEWALLDFFMFVCIIMHKVETVIT